LICIEEEVVINILSLMVQVKSEEQLQDPEMGSSGGLPSASSLMLETGSLYSSFSWTGVPDEADCWSQVQNLLLCFRIHIHFTRVVDPDM
jgi:hypothetical protein